MPENPRCFAQLIRRWGFLFAIGLTTLALVELINTVSTAQAVGNCNLQTLKNAVSSGGSLDLSCSTATTLTLDSGLIISKDLTLTNTGAGKLTISGAGTYGIFTVNVGIKLSLNNLTLDGGKASGGGAIDSGGILTITNTTFSHNSAVYEGGSILNGGTASVSNSTFSNNSAFSNNNTGIGGAIYNDGTLTITGSTLSNNSSTWGGAIVNYKTLTVTNSTFSNNSGSSQGGAFFNDSGGTLKVSNSTLSNNYAFNGGGAFYNYSGTITLKNTLINGSNNCSGAISDGGYNLDSGTSCGFSATGSQSNVSNAKLGPLADYGGPTQTIALLSGSPALDAIPVAKCTDLSNPPMAVTTDQRGVARPQSANCDIGAYEFKPNNTATKLVFSTQPAGATVGPPFVTQPLVMAQDGGGYIGTGFNGQITLGIKPGTGTAGATLSGTVTVTAVNGLATFSGLSIDKVGTGYVLVASAVG